MPSRSYKDPSRSSSISLSSSCRRLRQDGAISRRSSARLWASAHRFGAHDEPRAPSPLLTFLLHPDAPADALLLLYLAVNRASQRPPSRCGIPTTVWRRLGKLTSPPTKISSPSSPSASRPRLHHLGNHLNRRLRPIPSRSLAAGDSSGELKP
jgi:hypothetical protein